MPQRVQLVAFIIQSKTHRERLIPPQGAISNIHSPLCRHRSGIVQLRCACERHRRLIECTQPTLNGQRGTGFYSNSNNFSTTPSNSSNSPARRCTSNHRSLMRYSVPIRADHRVSAWWSAYSEPSFSSKSSNSSARISKKRLSVTP